MIAPNGTIVGIGVDIADVSRIKTALERQGDYFYKKVFTEAELSYCLPKQKPYMHLAARFSAKEAVAKAIRTGWSGIFRWKDVSVVNDASGAPHIVLSGKISEALAHCIVHLSLSHTDTTVVAFIVLERRP